MGKRAFKKHPRIPRDLYQTPPEAVEPLLPFLAAGTEFVEPNAASGRLIAHLEAAGHRCVDAYDIKPLAAGIRTADALQEGAPPEGAIYIANPPWKRPLLHQMIVRFSDRRPTWLLIDADWLYTKQSGQFAKRIRKIVSVGRVQWVFEGSKCAGFDNAVWVLFTEPKDEPALFFGPDDPPEAWAPIPSWPGYEASSEGRIRSVDRTVETDKGLRHYRGKILAPAPQDGGYLKVGVGSRSARRVEWVHILVAEAFLGRRPPGCEVAHWNGDPSQNAPWNLRYATPAENSGDKLRHGTLLQGEEAPGALLNADQVREIRAAIRIGEAQQIIADRFRVSRSTVSAIATGRSWASVPDEPARGGRVCFDCRMVIGRQDRWRLAQRAGVVTCVHRCCENPTSDRPRGDGETGPLPLFECLEMPA